MPDAPEISIVLPVWNGERYLREALDSILAQTFTDFECIIVNDCSTDSSAAIATDYAARDLRVILLNNETNMKLPASLNRGFSVARGRLFTWTSDDNRLLPECLSLLREGLLAAGADLAFSPYHAIDTHGDRLPVPENQPKQAICLDDLIWQNVIGACFLYKAAIHHALGGYDEKLFLVEDYDFWVRAYLRGFSFTRLDCAPYEYRAHEASLSSRQKIFPALIPLLYRIRNQFPKANREAHFRNRSALLTVRTGYLSWPQLTLVLCEALYHAPGETLRGIGRHCKKRFAATTARHRHG